MENTKTFKFVLGEETRPKIESFNDRKDIKNSIFFEQYKKALECIADFVVQSPDDSQNQSDNANFTKQQSYNIIFVFIGDRGSGKTSCMLTVNDIITHKNNYNNTISSIFEAVPAKKDNDVSSEPKGENKDNTNENKKESFILEEKREKIRRETNEHYQDVIDTFAEYTFSNCGTIDPTLFDNKHNILELFIGTLYKKMLEIIKQQDPHFYNNKYGKIINIFQDVKEHLTLLTEARHRTEYQDALQDIHDLTSVIDIKHDINTLINNYLSYMKENTSSRNLKLVLSIDDIDLNMSNAYIMIEQIRKYLSHPDLIILMAVKMGQLANVIRINYFNEFKVLLKQERDSHEINSNYKETINEIVERYMVKLFPMNQRIYLPDIEKVLNKRMTVYKLNKQGKQIKIEESDEDILKYQILNLIYQKFRILFYNTPQKTSYIVPRNLRELLNLTTLLYKLDDAPTHTEANNNLTFFKQYFENIWCKNNLDEQGQQIIQRLRKIRDTIDLNKTAIQLLNQQFKEATSNDNNIDKEIKNIITPNNIMYNISLGDVMAYLSWLEKVCYDDYDMKLLFAVKTFYSFKLYESYRNVNYSTEYQTKEEKEELTIVNRDPLPFNQTEYEDILNGSFLNSQYIDVAPDEKNIISRSNRIISAHPISELIKEYSSPSQTDGTQHADNENNNKLNYALGQKNVEFFMLTGAYVADAKNIKEIKDSKDSNKENIKDTKDNIILFEQSKNFRTQKAIYYKFKVTSSRKYLCFDVLSIFYNLLNVERTYRRYETYNPASKWHKGTSPNGLYTNILKYICIGEFLDVLRVLKVQKIPTQKNMLIYINEGKTLEDICRETGISIKEEQRTTVDNAYNECFHDIKEWNEKIAQEYEQKLRYKIHIRNVELIQQIAFLLELRRKDGSSDNISVLKEIFNALGNFKIIIHNENNISFEFFNAVRDFLDENLKDLKNSDENNDENNDENRNVFNRLFSSTMSLE